MWACGGNIETIIMEQKLARLLYDSWSNTGDLCTDVCMHVCCIDMHMYLCAGVCICAYLRPSLNCISLIDIPPQTPSLLEPFCVHKSGRPCACKTWTSNCRKANDGIKGLFQFIREVDLPVASRTESGSHSVTRHGNPAKTKANEEREHGQMQCGEQQQKNVL